MTEPKPEPSPRAAAALTARRGQIHALRTRVAVLAVSVFLAAWGVVFARLVEGHDPALASAAGAVVTQSADPAAADDEDAVDAAPTTVTTRQS